MIRKNFPIDILKQFVFVVADTLDSFSAYDVTKLLRARFPEHDIDAEIVKEYVREYVNTNNLDAKSNGTYIVYSKTSVKPNDLTAIIATGTSTHKSYSKFVSSMPNTTSPDLNGPAVCAPGMFLGDTNAKKTPQPVLKTVNLLARQEGKITLPIDVLSHLKNKTMYMHKDNNRIVILTEAKKGFKEVPNSRRFCTGWKENTECTVSYKVDYLEVKPS